MKERPILYSGPMVRPVLAGTKTQTRRPAYVLTKTFNRARFDRRFPPTYGNGCWPDVPVGHGWTLSQWYDVKVGDRLWVRETWAPEQYDAKAMTFAEVEASVRKPAYAADFPGKPALKWRPSIHMPRWASRITLEVTAVRVERLQDISEADALAEGIVATHGGYGLPDGSHFHASDPRVSYWSLWDAINGAGSVERNPWVFAISFKHHKPQIGLA